MHAEWQIDPTDFPRGAGTPERLHFCLRYAILAPSSHNSQPWRFMVDDGAVVLLADRTRSLAVVDPYDRELVMSCGAALFNLRAALAHFGMPHAIELFPVKADVDVIARVTTDARGFSDPALARLLAAIPMRATNRAAFSPIDLPEKVIALLREAAAAEGVTLTAVVALEDRKRVAGLVARADVRQFEDARFRRELASWIHGARERDGMPAFAFGVPHLMDLEHRVAGMVIRTFDLGGGVAAANADLAAHSPVLLCFSTPQDDAPAWLFAGQALERVLLTARLEGYEASYLNQPIEVPELRDELREVLGTERHPQLLIRIGRGPAAPHSRRRPLEEVLL
jgi:hypothetical protein